MEDPLEALLVSSKEVNRELLASILSRWVGIDRDTGEILPQQGYNGLRGRHRILVFLLASKAAAALDLRSSEGISPTELATAGGVPPGTVRRELREMLRERLVGQDKDGHYFVPAFALEPVKTIIGGATDG